MIERRFPPLKQWEGLFGGQCESIATLEKELDVAMSFENLALRVRLGLLDGIPAKAPHLPDAHIITRDDPVSLRIPRVMSLADKDFPAHLHNFHSALTSLVPLIDKCIQSDGAEALFTNVSWRARKAFSLAAMCFRSVYRKLVMVTGGCA